MTGAPLSPRELEVVRLAAEGLTNKAIAVRLSLSKRTVDVHLERVRAKTGLRNRVLLVHWLTQQDSRVTSDDAATAAEQENSSAR